MAENVRLSWSEVQIGGFAGVMRQVVNIHDGNQDSHGFAGNGLAIHTEGALAEMALAKAWNLYWTPVARDHRTLKADVGGRYHVRSTARHDGCLILHDDDPDDAEFVLVVGSAPSYRVAGVIRAGDGKRPEWWRDDLPRPAYFVPQGALNEPVL